MGNGNGDGRNFIIGAFSINGIIGTFTGDKIALGSRGDVHLAVLDKNPNYTWDSVSTALVGSLIDGRKVKGLEMFCTFSQTGRKIGILF
jgi:hypothetical protein